MPTSRKPAKNKVGIKNHAVVSHEKWLATRKAFLKKEKEFTRQRDGINRQRQDLPWELVEKEYVFEGPKGKETLADLFDGKSQLITYHFMFDPKWDAGCPHCSFWADNFDGIPVHLKQRDTTFVAISHAPYRKLAAYEKRMGWNFKWLSAFDTDFNYDYGVSFTPEEVRSKKVNYNYTMEEPIGGEREGTSVFFKDPSGRIFHTYSTFARGIDLMNTMYNYLDLTPKGRDEGDRGQYWVRRHDEYDP